MNSKTLNLIQRPYQEVIDDILTSLVGGVVNEAIIFDLKTDMYRLAEPAAELRKITGATETEDFHVFQNKVDFLFSEGDNAVVWQEAGSRPKDETIFYVDYYRRASRSPLTDVNVGSVTRTLGEAIGREIATVYQQINLAYLSGFIDTAQGKSLELVVAILGISRLTKDYARGEVTFFRQAAAKGNITIPQGTLLTTAKGEAAFVTTEMRTLQQGQSRINLPVRAADAFKGQAGRVAAGSITVLVLPIEGIDRVSNFDSTILGSSDETDAELRDRARAALMARGKGTLAALKIAVAENHATLIEVWDPDGPLDKRSNPGEVKLLVEAKPGYFPGLLAAVEDVRAAGVRATVVAHYVYFKPRIVLAINSGLTAAGKTKVTGQVKAALEEYVETLSSGEPAEGKKLLEKIQGIDDVVAAGTKMVDVMAWRSDVGRSQEDVLADAILTALQGIPEEDVAARQKAVALTVSQQISSQGPSDQRVADRSLVKGPSGGRATPEEIEAGDFVVVSLVNGDKWWLVLDLDETADIITVEKS